MLKKEIIGILKDKRTFLIILLVLIIPIIDLSVEYKQMNVAYARKHKQGRIKMIDIAILRENPTLVKENMKKK